MATREGVNMSKVQEALRKMNQFTQKSNVEWGISWMVVNRVKEPGVQSSGRLINSNLG